MTNANILAKIHLAQSRLETLHDILQDVHYLSMSVRLPAHIRNDLKRAADTTESIFYALTNIANRLDKSIATTKP